MSVPTTLRGIEAVLPTCDLYVIRSPEETPFCELYLAVAADLRERNATQYRAERDDGVERMVYRGARDTERRAIELVAGGEIVAPHEDELQDEPAFFIIVSQFPSQDVTPARAFGRALPVAALLSDATPLAAVHRNVINARDALVRGGATCLIHAYDRQLGFALMRNLLQVAQGLNVPVARDIQRRIAAAGLAVRAASSGLPFLRQKLSVVVDYFMPSDVVRSYKAVLDYETQASRALALRVADAPPQARAELEGEDVVDWRAEEKAMTGAWDPFGGVRGERADDDDESTFDSVADLASGSDEIGRKLADEAQNIYGARQDRHEFSAALYDSRRTDLAIAIGFGARPPAQLVHRFELALSCAVTLFLHLYACDVAQYQSLDVFYLFGLAQRELRRRVGRAGGLDGETQAAADALFEKQRAFRLANSAADIKALVERALAPEEAVVARVRELFDELRFNEVLDAFQAPHTRDLRRKNCRLAPMRRASGREVGAFIEHYELCDTADRLALAGGIGAFEVALRFSTQDATPLELATSVLTHVPEARDGVDFCVVWAPSLYDIPSRAIRTDCGRAAPPPGELFSDDNEREHLGVYLLLRQSAWHAIACGAYPRAVIERRRHGALEKDALLAAPILNHALRDSDRNVLIPALASVQSLTTHWHAAMPVEWSQDTSDAGEAVLVAANLSLVAHVYSARTAVDEVVPLSQRPLGATAAERDAERAVLAYNLVTPLLDRAERDGWFATRTDSIYAAVQVALAGNSVDVGLSLTTVDAFLAARASAQPTATSRHLAHERSVHATDSFARRERPRVGGDFRLVCRCGTTSQQCRSMRAQLALYQAKLSGADSAPATPSLLCCVCLCYTYRAAVAGTGKRSVRAFLHTRCCRDTALTAADQRCAHCEGRTIISGNLREPDFMVVYSVEHSNRDRQPSAATMVRELAMRGEWRTLWAFRMARGARQLPTTLPHNARRRVEERSTRKREWRALQGAVRRPRARLETQVNARTTAFLRAVPDSDAVGERHRLAMLVALEQLLLVEHGELIPHAKAGDERRVTDTLVPLDDDAMSRALRTGAVAAHEAQLALFPLASSALAESAACGAYAMQTAATDKRLPEPERARRLTFAGRTVRPLASMMPLLAELAFLHWHEPAAAE